MSFHGLDANNHEQLRRSLGLPSEQTDPYPLEDYPDPEARRVAVAQREERVLNRRREVDAARDAGRLIIDESSDMPCDGTSFRIPLSAVVANMREVLREVGL